MIPPVSPRVLLPLIQEKPDAPEPPTFSFGNDIARFGNDFNILFLRHRNWIIGADRWSGLDTVQSAVRIIQIITAWEEYGWICIWGTLDVIGVGGGVADNLWHAGDRFRQVIKPINVGLKSTEPHRYHLVRSELAWKLRRRVRAGRVHALTLDNPRVRETINQGILGEENLLDSGIRRRLTEQATTIQYRADEMRSGLIVVDSKEQYRECLKKLGMTPKSPDEFDALCLTYNDPIAGGKVWPGEERRPGVSQKMRESGNFMGR